MTLVIAILTKEYVLLATDRRITRNSALEKKYEDSDTKSFILDDRYVMGFAGLGRIPSKDIDEVSGVPKRRRMETWVSDVLRGIEGADYVTAITEAMGSVCEEVGYTGPHSFIVAGYRQEDESLVPTVYKITNSKSAPFTFYPYKQELNGDVIISYAGAFPDQTSFERLQKVAETWVARAPMQPSLLTRHIDRVFAATAAANETVGTSVLLTTLSRQAVRFPRGVRHISATNSNFISSYYLYDHHDSDSGKSFNYQFCPALFSPRGHMMGIKDFRGMAGVLDEQEGYS